MGNNKNYNPDVMPSFNFYKSWVGIFRSLSNSDRAILLNWMFWYCFEESEPDEEDLNDETLWRVAKVWETIKSELERQMEKWRKFCDDKSKHC